MSGDGAKKYVEPMPDRLRNAVERLLRVARIQPHSWMNGKQSVRFEGTSLEIHFQTAEVHVNGAPLQGCNQQKEIKRLKAMLKERGVAFTEEAYKVPREVVTLRRDFSAEGKGDYKPSLDKIELPHAKIVIPESEHGKLRQWAAEQLEAFFAARTVKNRKYVQRLLEGEREDGLRVREH